MGGLRVRKLRVLEEISGENGNKWERKVEDRKHAAEG